MINNQRFQHEMGHTRNTRKQRTGFMGTLLVLSKGAVPFLFTHTFIKPHLCVGSWARHWGHREQDIILARRLSYLKNTISLGSIKVTE